MLKDLLAEIIGFKYQTRLKVLLRKYKGNSGKWLATVYFNSTSKAVIGLGNSFDDSFQRILNRIEY